MGGNGRIVWFCGFLFLQCVLQALGSSGPTVLTPEEASKSVGKLAKGIGFGFSGVAFYSNRLYVSCNIGLLEVEGGRIRKAYRWSKSNPVVEGPWVDQPDGKLWVWRFGEGRLASYDGVVWSDVALPTDNYLRGDVLMGFRGVSTPSGFLLEGAGRVWMWNSFGQRWNEQAGSTVFTRDNRRGEVHRVLVIGDVKFVVMRYGRILPDYNHGIGDTVHRYASNTLFEVTNNLGKPFFAQETVAAGEKGYIRTRDGDLLQIDMSSVTAVQTPGVCEALAVTSDKDLVAAFRRLGVYRFKGNWSMLFPLTDPLDGFSWVKLAAEGPRVAVATHPMLHHGSAAGLWVFGEGTLSKIEFPLTGPKTKDGN